MNEFNFNSQVCTSRFQSERLLALGLKIETADCYHWQETDIYGDGNGKWHCEILSEYNKDHNEYLYNVYGVDGSDEGFFIPAWSLHRLIEMMPESIHLDSFANTHYDRTLLPSKIIYMKYDHTWIWQSDKQNGFDKCVDTIEWLIKEGYFNKEYLV